MVGEVELLSGLTFYRSEDSRQLLASVALTELPAELDEQGLRQQLAQQGFADWLLDEATVASLLHYYNTATPIQGLKLAEAVDARCEVRLAADRMQAFLTIYPPRGGKPVTRKDILTALSAQRIQVGILAEVVIEAVQTGLADELLIAQGKPVEHGQDGWFECLAPSPRSREPQVDEEGRINYRDLGEVVVVQPGDLLMRRHLATMGKPGTNVLGGVLPARPGKQVNYTRKLVGVKFSPDDPEVLIADVVGLPVLAKDGISVEPVYKIKQVNIASGNVDFDGTVIVLGDVFAGMTVKATGDIEVHGTVEPSVLEAGGNIVIKGGAIGKLGTKEAEEAYIRCDGSLTATYLQQARVEARDSVFVDDIVMQSEIHARNHVHIGQNKRGQVIGGSVQAMRSVSVKSFGSQQKIKTVISIDADPALYQELLALSEERDTKESQRQEVTKVLAFAEKNPGKFKPEILERARKTHAALLEAFNELHARYDALTEQINSMRKARITVLKAVHEGAQVSYGATDCFAVSVAHGPSVFSLVEGQINLSPLK